MLKIWRLEMNLYKKNDEGKAVCFVSEMVAKYVVFNLFYTKTK